MNYYKLYITDAFTNKEFINKSISEPIDLITKLSLKTLNEKPTYIIQAMVNTEKLNMDVVNGNPLLINLIGTPQDEFLVWDCQIQVGYKLHTTESCMAVALRPLEA